MTQLREVPPLQQGEGSWVIVDGDGKVVCEIMKTCKRAELLPYLNQPYCAVPIFQYLERLDAKIYAKHLANN